MIDRHCVHVGHSFSVVGNKLKLNIVLVSEVDLYIGIQVHGPIYSNIDLAKSSATHFL